MDTTQEPDIGWAAIATQGKRLIVMELEARALAATSARRVDEAAAVSVPLGDGSFHGSGNVTRARRGVGCGNTLRTRLHLPQTPGLNTLQFLADSLFDDGRQVTTVE